MGHKDYYIVYICTINDGKVPSDIKSGSAPYNTNGSSIVQPLDANGTTVFSARGCAKVTVGTSEFELLCSPSMYYKINTGKHTLYYDDGTSKEATYSYKLFTGAYGVKKDGEIYDSNGDKYYRIRLAIDLAPSDLDSADWTYDFSIPSIYDYDGDMSCTDSNASCTVSNDGRSFGVRISGNKKHKIYYINFRVKLKMCEIPSSYPVDSKGYAFLYITGTGFDTSVDQIGATGGWGSYGKYTLSASKIGPLLLKNVYFDTDGGTINSGAISKYRFGTTTKLPTDVTKEGYTFLGWDDERISGTQIVTEIGPTERNNAYFIAVWQANKYKVTLHPNGGTIQNGYNIQEYTQGTTAYLPSGRTITKQGAEFAGWYDNNRFSGTPVNTIAANETGDKEYWAKWITFDIKGNKFARVLGSSEDRSIYRGENITFKVETESMGNMFAYFTSTNDVNDTKLSGMRSINANTMVSLPMPEKIAKDVANDVLKKDRIIYLHIMTRCSTYDAQLGRNYGYSVYNTVPIIVRFAASFSQR